MQYADRAKLMRLAQRYGAQAALDTSAAIDAHHMVLAMKAQGIHVTHIDIAREHRYLCLQSARRKAYPFPLR